MPDDGATWLASYPKSGNTWLRCLLQAYRSNGHVDINDIGIAINDGGFNVVSSVSPLPRDQMGLRGELLVRPAGLINFFCHQAQPVFVKTHFANLTLEGLSSTIPADLTKKAVYIVRDPRSVILSFSRYFAMSTDMAADKMNEKDFCIGGTKTHANTLVSSWSNHVRSWIGEKAFPVHVVKYEDMVDDAPKELTEILEFIGWEVDEKRVARAVSAAKMSKLQKAEQDKGFKENSHTERGAFFGGGGSRWKDELGPKWQRRIENDHGDVMKLLGYL